MIERKGDSDEEYTDDARGDMIVLAGGRSRRFGEGDKALADLAGKPLVRHGADRCGEVTDRTVVNCRPDQHEALAAAFEDHESPVSFAIDDVTDAGPIAGMAEGLQVAESEYALVLACDLPFVESALAEVLFELASVRDGAVPRLDGRLQPTCAVYRVEPTLAACRQLLEDGERRTMALVDRLSVRTVEEGALPEDAGPGSFLNVNTRAALERAQRRLVELSP